MANSARIDELRKKFDENPRRYFAPLANEYRKAGDQEQAIFICQEYLPQQPGHMSGHIVYGQALFELSRFDEAKAVFETALTLDPENLIALRHLGDIARQAGDFAAARQWYQRVLEADPRNEEIAQLMLSLLGSDGEAPAAHSPAGAPPVDHNAPTPLSTPAVLELVIDTPSEPALVDDLGGFSIEKSPDHSEIQAPPPLPPPQSPPLQSTTLPEIAPEPVIEPFEAHVAAPPADEPPPIPVPAADASDDLLDLADFSIGGLSTPPESEAPQPVPAAEPSATAHDDDLGFNLGDEDGPFEADPFAIAAAPAAPEAAEAPAPMYEVPAAEPPQPEIELAADLDIGLPDDSPVSAPVTAAEPPAEEIEAKPVGGLESFEAGVADAATVEAPVLDIVAFDATPLSTAAIPSAPIDGGHDGRDVPEQEAFITETMAELYLQQGHLESALEIYHKLVSARPDDAALQDRMRAVEARLYGTPESIDEPVAEPVPAGPTIREFLQSLLRPRAAVEPVADLTNAADEPAAVDADDGSASGAPDEPNAPWASESDLVEAEAAAPFDVGAGPVAELDSASADAEWQAPEVPRPTPSATETVSGSIDALFTGAEASTNDSAAASALAEAFAPEGPETAPLHGMPAHRASSELSLDHVFKTGTPPRGESADAFSFDQFFSEEMTQASTPADMEAGAAPREAPDDIAQFNAWLNGLKKT